MGCSSAQLRELQHLQAVLRVGGIGRDPSKGLGPGTDLCLTKGLGPKEPCEGSGMLQESGIGARLNVSIRMGTAWRGFVWGPPQGTSSAVLCPCTTKELGLCCGNLGLSW